MVVSALSGAHLERGAPAVISKDKVLQNDGFDTGRTHDLPDPAGVRLDEREPLATPADRVENETDRSRPNRVIREGIYVELIAAHMGNRPSVTHRALTDVVGDLHLITSCINCEKRRETCDKFLA